MVVFDLDGTLLRGETVCELLARPLGRIEEMRQFELLSSEPDIAEARSEMARWYRDHSIGSLQRNLSSATWAPGAREAVSELLEANVLVGIASITWKFAVKWFADQLAVRHYLGTDLGTDGEIIHVWGRDKAEWLKQLMARNAIPPTRVAAVGDSRGDLEMLRVARLRFLVGRVDLPDLQSTVHLPEADLRTVSGQILQAWK